MFCGDPILRQNKSDLSTPELWKKFKLHKYRVRKISFFLENALKNTIEYFLKFLFLFESTILSVNSGK